MKRMAAAWALVMIVAATAGAAVYTVDQNHPKAGDDNPGTAEAPLKTIQAADRLIAPGDTVIIRGGVYRETVWHRKNGEPGKPITIKAAQGERVVLTGADPITGWRKCTLDDVEGNKNFDKILMVDLDRLPRRLFDEGKLMHIARTPEAGYWGIGKGLSLTEFTSPQHLTQKDPKAWDGWTVAILEQAGGGVMHIEVARFDPATHKITMARPYSSHRKKIDETDQGRDRFFMENHISTLDGPGQYVFRKTEKGCRIFAWPSKLDADGQPSIETPNRDTLFHLTDRAHLVIDGLEVCYGTSHGLGMGRSGSPKNVVIQNCYVHDNASYGIEMRRPIKCTIRRNVLPGNGLGANIGGAQDTVVEENDIGWNRGDGLVAPGGTRNLVLQRNYIHDHYLWGHPDNIQFWSDVEGTIIRDNVMLNSGQTMMSDGMTNTKLINNVWLGSYAISMICGGNGWEIRNNTVCATAPMPTNYIGKNFNLVGNIFAPLHDTPIYSMPDPATFKADYNLLWAGPDYKKTLVIKGAWKDDAASLSAIREKFGQETHGLVADPKFVNAAKFFCSTDYRRVHDCTTTKFITSPGNVSQFAIGDHVELDFDGVVRKVVEVGPDYIVVDKPLDVPPLTIQSIANWGDKTDFTWDLHLDDGSPAKGAGPDGRDMGSSLDVQAYIKGDFNGDGKRDLPVLPK